MLELGTSEQEPVNSLIAFCIFDGLRVELVKNGDRLLCLFLLLQFFVLFNNCIALLELTLVSLNLIGGERHTAERIKNG